MAGHRLVAVLRDQRRAGGMLDTVQASVVQAPDHAPSRRTHSPVLRSCVSVLGNCPRISLQNGSVPLLARRASSAQSGEALLLPKQWHTGFAESLSCVHVLTVSGFAEAEQLQALMRAWLDPSDNDTEKTYGADPQVIKAASSTYSVDITADEEASASVPGALPARSPRPPRRRARQSCR